MSESQASTGSPILLKNSLFSVIQVLVSSFSYVLIYFAFISILGKAQLGVWSIITSIPTSISIFGSGVSGCLLRFVPVSSTRDNKKDFNEIVCNGIIFNLLLSLVICIFGIFFTKQIITFLFSSSQVPEEYFYLFKISLGIFFINFINSVVASTLDGLQKIYLRNKITIVSTIAFCISSIILVVFYGLKGAFYAQIIQCCLNFFLNCFFLSKEKLFDFKFFRINFSYLKLFLNYGKGFQFISISIMLFEPLTKFFLNKYFDLSTVGLYDLANRFILLIRTMIVSAIQTIVPMISQRAELGLLNIKKIYNKTLRGANLLGLVVFGGLLCFTVPLVILFKFEDPKLFYFITLFLSISYYFNILATAGYSIFLGLGLLKHIIVSHIISSLLNALLYLAVGRYLSGSFVVIPIAISIIVSSFWIFFSFTRHFKLSHYSIKKTDLRIVVSILFLISFASLVVANTSNIYFSLLPLVLYFAAMIIFLPRNDFFSDLLDKVLKMIGIKRLKFLQ